MKFVWDLQLRTLQILYKTYARVLQTAYLHYIHVQSHSHINFAHKYLHATGKKPSNYPELLSIQWSLTETTQLVLHLLVYSKLMFWKQISLWESPTTYKGFKTLWVQHFEYQLQSPQVNALQGVSTKRLALGFLAVGISHFLFTSNQLHDITRHVPFPATRSHIFQTCSNPWPG